MRAARNSGKRSTMARRIMSLAFVMVVSFRAEQRLPETPCGGALGNPGAGAPEPYQSEKRDGRWHSGQHDGLLLEQRLVDRGDRAEGGVGLVGPVMGHLNDHARLLYRLAGRGIAPAARGP